MEAARDSTTPDRWLGAVLDDRYVIEALIGEGAMGAVYRAHHLTLGRACAVKVLHPDHAASAKLAERFEREARIVGLMHHRNIVNVVDGGVLPDGTRYLVTELVDGVPLGDLVDDGPMPAPRVLALMKQLVAALAHAHDRGLVHRDLKPDNILVETDESGREVVRLIDFGIAITDAVIAGDEPARNRLTTDGLVLGTPHYMAPETATGGALDHRADLFAVGIICFELLTGRLPFDGTGAQVALANVRTPTPVMADRVPYLEVDPLLEALTRTLMEKSPSLRIASAHVLADLLELITADPAAAALQLGVAPAPATTRRRARSMLPPLAKG